MSIHRRIARFNRAVANPLIGRVAPSLPGLGVVLHRGRRTGRAYRTPVVVFRTDRAVEFALPYGPESDWVRNTLAAGGCELLTRGRRIALTGPSVHTGEPPGASAPVRAVLRRFSALEYLSLSLATAPAKGERP